MEGFFSAAREDPCEIIDLIAHRYGWSLDKIEIIPVLELKAIVKTAERKERDKQIREQWLMLLPLMQMGTIKFTSLEDYKVHVSGGDIDTRPAEEIIAEVAEIRKTMGVNNGSV
jgi:hypothetical protein